MPFKYVRRPVVVLATMETVRIFDGSTVIATHRRSWDKGQEVEIEEHVCELVAWKQAARHHRGLDRLHHATPHAAPFFAALAQRGGNLGAATTGLTRLLDLDGAPALDAALAQALSADSAHLSAVRQILEQHQQARHQVPPVAVALPDDPRVRNLIVQPHDLATYDRLALENSDDDDDTNGR